MKKFTNNGMDFIREGQNVVVDDIAYYCPNEAWLNEHGYYEYVEQWGNGEDGIVDNKWVHYIEVEPKSLEEVRQNKLYEIDVYDTSDAVNGFIYQDQIMWIDKVTRVGIMNAIECTMTMGEDVITFGVQDVSITLPCSDAIKMMAALEVYALKCYNTTLQHKREVSALETIEEIKQYDITAGYPDKLSF